VTVSCTWSKCRETEGVRLYGCGTRCPKHTPSALRGQLEPDELLEQGRRNLAARREWRR
jgi:hypothetical protein